MKSLDLEEAMQSVDISVVVPMHNAVRKLGRCMDSLAVAGERLDRAGLTFEVIVVDDCSEDGTADILRGLIEGRQGWQLLSMPENSGSPSRPRNIGLAAASGRYVFFLDGDDEIDPEGILSAITLADEHSHDLVRGPVQVLYLADERRVLIDTLSPPPDASAEDMLELIARGQSLNCSALWRRNLLVENSMVFDTETRMGEDIVFTAEAMSKAGSIGYVNSPLFHYVRQPGGGGSSMHHFGGRELRELVSSWQKVEDHFQSRGLSYLELHGDRTINYALRLVIRYHMLDLISQSDAESFAEFFMRNRDKLRRIKFVDDHVAEFVAELSMRGVIGFWEFIKPRLLIAGHDLKFILPAVPALRRWFSIRVDEWPSEIKHSEARSRSLLAWADYVWVEWLTAASVWYAERVRPTQNLVVRMHRYELGRSYGDIIARDNVDAFIAIAPHCMEDMIERFEFDRGKVRFLPNYYMIDDYERAAPLDEDRLYRLALIGAVPQRKGLLRGLELLKILLESDSRYSLSIMGRRPEDMPWIGSDPFEQQYFAACEEFIRAHGMEDSVEWVGWTDTRSETMNYGFVLSLSEHEGSHVGPGEAYCAGNQGIFLRWRGAEFVYPENLVFDTMEEMADHVLAMRDVSDFNRIADDARTFMVETYDVSLFVERVRGLFRSVG